MTRPPVFVPKGATPSLVSSPAPLLKPGMGWMLSTGKMMVGSLVLVELNEIIIGVMFYRKVNIEKKMGENV